MLGYYIIGLTDTWGSDLFAALVAVCLTAGYALVGACWLIAKTSGELQVKAIRWARFLVFGTGIGVVAISIATPLASQRVFDAWFSMPNILLLAPIPLMSFAILLGLHYLLSRMPTQNDSLRWLPFTLVVALFLLAFTGLAYSFFPYVVPDKFTIWESAASRESLMIILVGTLITLPMIIGYTVFAYRVFRGKAMALTYD